MAESVSFCGGEGRRGLIHSRFHLGGDRRRLHQPRRHLVFAAAAAAKTGSLSNTSTSASNRNSIVDSRWNSCVAILQAFGRYLNVGMYSSSSLSSVHQHSAPVKSYSASQWMTANIIYASFGRSRIQGFEMNVMPLRQQMKNQPYLMEMNLSQTIRGYQMNRLHQPPSWR